LITDDVLLARTDQRFKCLFVEVLQHNTRQCQMPKISSQYHQEVSNIKHKQQKQQKTLTCLSQ